MIRLWKHVSPKPISSSVPFLIRSRSLSSPNRTTNNNPIKWKSSHSFVHSNPLLSLLDNGCESMAHLKQIQTQMTVTGLISDPFASSRVVAFCALSESRDLDHCLALLFSSDRMNSFSWNTAIRGFAESEFSSQAVVLYKRMFENGFGSTPDRFTYPLVLKVCADLGSAPMGFQILGHVLKLGFDSHVFVHNATIHMLVSCGELINASKLFEESSVRDLVSWNSLINGFARAGRGTDALRLYGEMIEQGIEPDDVTMIGLVSSCSRLEDLKKGRELHLAIREKGINLTAPLINTLMDMYVTCGDIESARELFDKMPTKTGFSWATMISGYAKSGSLDTALNLLNEMPMKEKNNAVPWNAMIGGYVLAKCGKEALALFQEMQYRAISPDTNTMIGCLSACSQLGALEIGIWIHHYIEKNKHNNIDSSNLALRTALGHMYAKCGEIEKALQVFDETPDRNSLTWTSVICGLASHGRAHEAIACFEEMTESGLVPDEVTFLGLLSGCCHGGLVEEGRYYFAQMTSRFNLFPNPRHYAIMVDLLGRAGLLDEAEEVIKSMKFEPDAAILGALFFACRVHKNVAMGERAASRLLEVDPGDSGNYVLLASLYKDAKMWDRAEVARRMMRERGVVKTPGCSSIEVSGVVREFTVSDSSGPESLRIYECLDSLASEIDTFNGNLLVEQGL